MKISKWGNSWEMSRFLESRWVGEGFKALRDKKQYCLGKESSSCFSPATFPRTLGNNKAI